MRTIPRAGRLLYRRVPCRLYGSVSQERSWPRTGRRVVMELSGHEQQRHLGVSPFGYLRRCAGVSFSALSTGSGSSLCTKLAPCSAVGHGKSVTCAAIRLAHLLLAVSNGGNPL